MKVQACIFARTKGGKKEAGLAFQQYFDSNDVEFIIDDMGKRVQNIWKYDLINPSFQNPNIGIDLDKVFQHTREDV